MPYHLHNAPSPGKDKARVKADSVEDAKKAIAGADLPDFVKDGAKAILDDFAKKGVKSVNFAIGGHCPAKADKAEPGTSGSFNCHITVVE